MAELQEVKTRLERTCREELVRLAALSDRSLSGEIRRALRQYVESRKATTPEVDPQRAESAS